MIKRILSVALVIVMLFTVTACEEKELTVDEVFAAVERTASLESFKQSFDVNMRMLHEEEYLDTVINGTTEKALADGQSVTKTYVDMDYGSTQSQTELYLLGDTAYISSAGQKLKLPAEYVSSGVPVIELKLITRDCIESVTRSDDGYYNAVLKEGSLNAFIVKFLGAEDSTHSIYKNVTLSFKIDDGYVSEGRFGFTLSTSDDDMGDYGTVAECTFAYENPGEDASITLPDFAEYIDAVGNN